MSNIFSILKSLCPDQVCLEVSPKQLEQAWPSQQEYSYDVARWTAYKNRLTLDAFLDWLQAESGIEEQPQVLPSRDDLSSIWEVVNGAAIEIGGTRIVLIPEAMDTDEYEVQAEWVDIPSWAADYYLAVQVNPDDGWLRIWGYTTHKKLKQVGQYNSIRRTYSLKREELIEDLNVMWVARELGCDRKAVVKPSPTLSPAQVERLLEQLSHETSYSPRLLVKDFDQWKALLEHGDWRQCLYQQRQRLQQSIPLVQLSRWLEQQFEAGWQSVESLLKTQTVEPAWSFREARTIVERAKSIDFGRVLLVVRVTPTTVTEMKIIVVVQPSDGQTNLPAELELALLNEDGGLLVTVSGNSTNKNMQLDFSGERGEKFSVKLTLGNVSVVEHFVI